MLPRSYTAKLLFIAVFYSLLSSGCGEYRKLFEVNGTATYAGKPLANVTLHFNDPAGWESSVDTDIDGRFTLRIPSKSSSLETHICKVWVSSQVSGKSGNFIDKPKKNPELQPVLEKYGSAASSPKTIEIKESEMKVDLD